MIDELINKGKLKKVHFHDGVVRKEAQKD